MDFDYKKYSLENLENWLHDAISCNEATPKEIYDVIKEVVRENYYTYKHCTSRCSELLELLNGHGKGHIPAYDSNLKDEWQASPWAQTTSSSNKDDVITFNTCGVGNTSKYYTNSWNDFWTKSEYSEDHFVRDMSIYSMAVKQDKVSKWQLPVQLDGLTGDVGVNLPEDLLEAANLKEGDQVEWIDRGDGSFELRKVNGIK